ncbi:GNAT family N-acetyltransferase [Pseudomonas tohonis]|jgi:GNAT superfamily N-acetyltransferase|uniref:GNAT family N-acetyltransferase n=1 Tax=Pseudomonas tohonis TaxID=2725477 RepID=UPI001F1FE3FB|nr:GNAT family N-acetyltransferase [Pseudomonas tohonis]
MANRPHIRTALDGDIAALCALDPIACLEQGRRHFIATAVAAGQCWVATEADDASALLGYGVINDAFFEQDFIPLLVVRESARRRGIASALIGALEGQGTGAKLFTSTNASNAPMRSLLAKLGFVPSGHIDNLDEGDPELVFVKFRPHAQGA